VRPIPLASVGLTAQERGDLELIVVHLVVNRSLPAVLVESLRSRPRGDRPLGIFRHGFGTTRFRCALQRGHRRSLRHRRCHALGRDRRLARGRRGHGLFLFAAAEADGGETLQQTDALFLRGGLLNRLGPGRLFVFEETGRFWTSTLEAVRTAYEIIGDDVCDTCPRHFDSLNKKDGWYYLI